MRVLSYLRMEIDPDQIEAYEEDLEEMIRMAGETPGFLGVEVFRARGEPNVQTRLRRGLRAPPLRPVARGASRALRIGPHRV
jgi:Antibiotic biosynthesis monooxygenase